MKSLIYISFLLLVVLVSLSQVSWSQSKYETSVQGNVLNNTDTLIPKVSIVLINLSTGEKTLTKTDDNGRYSIDIKSGKYRITAKRSGFCPQTRAPFVVEKESLIRMNMYMYVCSIVSNVVIESSVKSEIKDTYEYPYKQETLAFQKQKSTVNEIMIQYFKKTNLDGGTIYHGKNNYPALFSYNFLLVKSDSITAEGGNIFSAEGDVMLEDKSNTKAYEKVTFLVLENDYKILCSKQEKISTLKKN